MLSLLFGMAAVYQPAFPDSDFYRCAGIGADGGETNLDMVLTGPPEARRIGLRTENLFQSPSVASGAELVSRTENQGNVFELFNVRIMGSPLTLRVSYRTDANIAFDIYTMDRNRMYGPAVTGMCEISEGEAPVLASEESDFPQEPPVGTRTFVAPATDWEVSCRLISDDMRWSEASVFFSPTQSMRYVESNTFMETARPVEFMRYVDATSSANRLLFQLEGSGQRAHGQIVERRGQVWLDITISYDSSADRWLRGRCVRLADPQPSNQGR